MTLPVEVMREGGERTVEEGENESIGGSGLDTKHTRGQDDGKETLVLTGSPTYFFSAEFGGGVWRERERGKDRYLEGGLVVAV